MKTLKSKLTLILTFFALITLALGIVLLPKNVMAQTSVNTETGFYIEDGAIPSVKENGEGAIKWEAHITKAKYDALKAEGTIEEIGIKIYPAGQPENAPQYYNYFGGTDPVAGVEPTFTEEKDEVVFAWAIYYGDLVNDLKAAYPEITEDETNDYLAKAYALNLEAVPYVKYAPATEDADPVFVYGEKFDTARSIQGLALYHLLGDTATGVEYQEALEKYFIGGYSEAEFTSTLKNNFVETEGSDNLVEIDPAIDMENAKIFYGAREITADYNAETRKVALNNVALTETTDGQANAYLAVLTADNVAYKQPFTVVTKVIDEAQDLSIFMFQQPWKVGWVTDLLYTYTSGDFLLDGYYVLANNIDATGYYHDHEANVMAGSMANYGLRCWGWDAGSYIERMGTFASKNWAHNDGVANFGLTGTFDGQGYTISNLTTNFDGLFGLVQGGTIKNVAFDNCSTRDSSRDVAEETEHAYGFLAWSIHSTKDADNNRIFANIENVFVNTPEVEVNYAYAPAFYSIGRYVNIKNFVTIDNTTLDDTVAEKGYHGYGSLSTNAMAQDQYLAGIGDTRTNVIVVSDKPLTAIANYNQKINNFGTANSGAYAGGNWAEVSTHKAYHDAKFIDGVEQEDESIPNVAGTWNFTKQLSDVRRYTDISKVAEDATLDLSGFNSDMWTVVDGLPIMSSIYDITPTVFFGEKAVVDGTIAIDVNDVVDVTAKHNTLDAECSISADASEFITVEGNTVTAVKPTESPVTITVVVSGEEYTVNLSVLKPTQEITEEYYFSAMTGEFFNSNFELVSLSTILGGACGDSTVVTCEGQTLVYDVANGTITGYNFVGQDYVQEQLAIDNGSDYIYLVNVKVAELIIDQATDLSAFKFQQEVTFNYDKITYVAGDFYMDGYYVLADNIDATGYYHDHMTNATAGSAGTGFKRWGWEGGAFIETNGSVTWCQKDGTAYYGLIGTFDGQGHTISNLTTDFDGLFGVVQGGTIKNVAFDNCGTKKTATSTASDEINAYGFLAASINGGGVYGGQTRFYSTVENVFINTPKAAVSYAYSPAFFAIGTCVNMTNFVIVDNTWLSDTVPTDLQYRGYGSLATNSMSSAGWCSSFGNAKTNVIVVSDKALTVVVDYNRQLNNLQVASARAEYLGGDWTDASTHKAYFDAKYIDGVEQANVTIPCITGAYNITQQVTGIRRYTDMSKVASDANASTFTSALVATGYFTYTDGVIGWAK